MQRIRKGDTVEVISGKDRGQRGTVLRVLTKDDRVVIEGVNILKKHQRAQQAGTTVRQAGIVQFEGPIHLSNVMLVCTQCDARTRVGFRITDEDRKVRVCHKCGQDID